ncbi:MBL fold metallo-hydrolase [Candidatus Leptofilum sp.]|uniref:MBL fold metallo-hydrolase n=1 Tax=Candidatus Leptofilum sp. TaxID=3241576 RepID=UPI003B59D637
MNCYLVKEEDGFTVIDTGMAGMEKMILKAAEEQGQSIRRVVLTHAHSDHIGGLDALKKALPNIAVIASEQSARFIAGDMSLEPGQADAALKGDFPSVESRPTATVKDNDMVGSLKVIATPGHTPGHISLYDERDGSLVAGDAFQTLGGVAVAGVVRWLFPFPGKATWHKATAVQSAEKLLALHPARLATGHGKILENPTAVMQKAIAEAKK